METSPRSGFRLVSPLTLTLLLFAGGASLGCYRPAVVDGKLLCNLDAGTKPCPDGFKCEMSTHTCKRNPSDAGPETGDVGTDADGMIDAPTDADGPMCFEPKMNCTPASTGTCDPFCQTGCACREKCSVNTGGSLTCNPPRTQGFPRGLMQDCTIESGNSMLQTDNCGPGLVCIEDGCFPRCYKFCKSDNDCTNAPCNRDVGGGQKVCDVPWVDTCTPLGSGSNTGCAGTNMACYISSAAAIHTICDCPQNAGAANATCTRTRDCFPGLACVDRQPPASPTCLQVCRLNKNGSDCPSMTMGACHPYTGIPPGQPANTQFGYCF